MNSTPTSVMAAITASSSSCVTVTGLFAVIGSVLQAEKPRQSFLQQRSVEVIDEARAPAFDRHEFRLLQLGEVHRKRGLGQVEMFRDLSRAHRP